MIIYLAKLVQIYIYNIQNYPFNQNKINRKKCVYILLYICIYIYIKLIIKYKFETVI